MNFWNNFKRRCARRYINSLHRVTKDTGTHMVQIEGETVSALPGTTPKPLPFMSTKYYTNLDDAMSCALVEKEENPDYRIEIWEMVEKL